MYLKVSLVRKMTFFLHYCKFLVLQFLIYAEFCAALLDPFSLLNAVSGHIFLKVSRSKISRISS